MELLWENEKRRTVADVRRRYNLMDKTQVVANFETRRKI